MTNPTPITAEMFEAATGYKPENDDLERCNCPKAGTLGHSSCGWNYRENLPVFMTGPDPTINPLDNPGLTT